MVLPHNIKHSLNRHTEYVKLSFHRICVHVFHVVYTHSPRDMFSYLWIISIIFYAHYRYKISIERDTIARYISLNLIIFTYIWSPISIWEFIFHRIKTRKLAYLWYLWYSVQCTYNYVHTYTLNTVYFEYSEALIQNCS